ncbi:hypothetical protein NEISICOT_03053 [Neisseria sicca ATCC 29256]|uniref:Uncharacterized protein n=1 Tax=Neisseria sicca ATCC 29256 TaxID=547045 RepID=C6M927_NEISI|nr:hypothetical protein NEISICOT_03053 [Neisseria sicca ATCC 29256]
MAVPQSNQYIIIKRIVSAPLQFATNRRRTLQSQTARKPL